MEIEEYKRRFMARIVEKVDDGDTPLETLEGIAKSEYEGMDDFGIDEDPDPESDADECLSYWG